MNELPSVNGSRVKSGGREFELTDGLWFSTRGFTIVSNEFLLEEGFVVTRDGGEYARALDESIEDLTEQKLVPARVGSVGQFSVDDLPKRMADFDAFMGTDWSKETHTYDALGHHMHSVAEERLRAAEEHNAAMRDEEIVELAQQIYIHHGGSPSESFSAAEYWLDTKDKWLKERKNK